MKRIWFLLFVLISVGCKSIDTVYKFKYPEAETFELEKVLVIGFSTNYEARYLFEDKLVSKFIRNDIEAVKSVDYFNRETPINKWDIEAAQDDLIKKGFNAILVSKVISTDEKRTMLQAILNLNKSYNSFDNDNTFPNFNYDKEKNRKHMMYNTETAIYCICPEEEKSLIWNTTIELKKHRNTKRDINQFVSYLWTSINDALDFNK